MGKMQVSIIVAMGHNRAIGYKNALPWRLPADLQHFKQKTSGHHVIMGRKTFESIGRVLPGRTFIVVSRQTGYRAEGCLVVNSVEEGISLAKRNDETEAFIIGGMEIYTQALPLCDRLYITEVEASPMADAFFPDYDESQWKLVELSRQPADQKNEFAMRFVTLERNG